MEALQRKSALLKGVTGQLSKLKKNLDQHIEKAENKLRSEKENDKTD